MEGFEEYYQDLIDAEVIQFIGRQRAHQFPEQNFITYLVGTELKVDYLKSLGIQVSESHAFELSPEAGTRKQFSQFKLIKAMKQILARQGKITAQSLAKESGLSFDYIRDLVSGLGGMMAFKKWGLDLYDSYRTNPQNLDPEFLLQNNRIRDWMALNPLEAVQELWQAIQDVGWRDFHEYLSVFTVDIQAQIWGLIAELIFPSGAISELEKALSPPVDIGAS